MTVANWVQALKSDPTINQLVTLMESKKLDTVKVEVGNEMSQELKQYLSNREHCVCKKGFCISMVIELDGTVMSYFW